MYKDPLTTKVTTINGRYHCRLIKEGNVVNEMACRERQDVGYCFKYMLRMYDKCGYEYSKMADASRHRQKGDDRREVMPKGKIWYPSQIPVKE